MSRNDRQSTFPPDFSNPPNSAEEEPFFMEVEEPAADAPPQSALDESGKPGWFRGPANKPPAPNQTTPPDARQSGRRPATAKSTAKPGQQAARKRSPLIHPDQAEPEEELTWQEQVKRWIYGEGGAGYGVSVVVHIVLLLVMSLWILAQPEDKEVVITAAETEMVDVAALQDVDIVDMEEEVIPQVNNPDFEPAPLSAPDLGVNMLALTASNTTAGGLDLKIPMQAVTKGSFTVWTVPADPRPGEQYKIMIKIELKNSVKRYPRRDLSGNVVGTDGYKDYFGGPTEAGYIPVMGSAVQIEACRVPGAAQLVKDVITVESKILMEKQTIDLIF